MGCGSGMTCWRRLRDWQAAGVWEALHRALLDTLGRADRIDWSRAAVDSCRRPGQKGGACTGPNPTDRGKPGAKHHLLTDRRGIPLAALQTAANVSAGAVLEDLVDAVPPIRRPHGRPRRRPATAARRQGGRPALLPAGAAPAPQHAADRAHGERRRATASAATAGSASGRWPGCLASAACACATSGGTTSSWPSSRWAVRSSAATTSHDGFARHAQVARASAYPRPSPAQPQPVSRATPARAAAPAPGRPSRRRATSRSPRG